MKRTVLITATDYCYIPHVGFGNWPLKNAVEAISILKISCIYAFTDIHFMLNKIFAFQTSLPTRVTKVSRAMNLVTLLLIVLVIVPGESLLIWFYLLFQVS